MQVADTIAPLKGRWRFDIYDGDVERRPLTREQIHENKTWRQICEAVGLVYMPLHIGQVVSRPIDTYELDNLVTTNGKGLLLDRLFNLGTPPSQVTHMGVGNSATTAATGDTQLLGATPAPALLPFDALPTRSGLVVTATRTFATGEGNMNWQEAGLFNGATNGTSILFNRIAPIGPFNKTSAVAIGVSVTITQG